MNTVNPTEVPGHRKPAMRRGWKPGAWAISLCLAWLVLMAVPMLGLHNLDQLAPGDPDAQPKPWMPIYAPIV